MSSERFAKIPKLMLKSEMPNGAIRLYGFIACHAIANNKPFLSYEYILENSTINDRNTVSRYIKSFDKRFIETKRRFNNSNVFLVKKPKKQDYEFVPMSFITDKRITDSAFLLYVAALFHWPDDTGGRHIKKKDLMKQAGIKSRTTLRKTLNLLQELDYSKISEEKQSVDITLYFKDGQIHRGNIPEKKPSIFPQKPFIFSHSPSIFPPAPFIFPYDKKTFEKDFLSILSNYGTEQRSWFIEKNNTIDQNTSFAGDSPAPETPSKINRGYLRAGGKFCSPAQWAQALSDYKELSEGEKEQVQAYVEHEANLYPFHKYNTDEDYFKKKCKVEYMVDHEIAKHFKALTPEQRQMELDNDSVYQNKIANQKWVDGIKENKPNPKPNTKPEPEKKKPTVERDPWDEVEQPPITEEQEKWLKDFLD